MHVHFPDEKENEQHNTNLGWKWAGIEKPDIKFELNDTTTWGRWNQHTNSDAILETFEHFDL